MRTELDLDDSPAPSVADDRYVFVRQLGSGGSGVVYLVRDRETGEQLAWKELQRTDERSITRLKREFRTLSNINHRNVIRLYDLGRARDSWFLTMEYLNGVTLLDYIDGNASRSASLRRTGTTIGADAVDLPRIASVFHQLATGVQALHQAGVLHRDLKPSNVIVESERVVVLDFGLALTVGDQAATITMDGLVAGTPAYMPPEQLQGRDWGEPNDWYAFGVMLYEALTGCLPIEGRVQELLRRKLEQDPVPIERHIAGLPPALCRMCNGLIQRQPELRPTAAEVLAVLAANSGSRDARRSDAATPERRANLPRTTDGSVTLFGREPEREQLGRAFADVESGGSAVVHVRGVSGAGKSALVEHFLEELEQEETLRQSRALILRGRCYERETVAFKALDAVIDALVTQLSREDDVEVGHMLPRDVPALVQLFPALERLSAVKQLLRPAARTQARTQAREAAEAALRDLFTRLGSRRSVIIWIDDLHWGDTDSARILKGWTTEPAIAGLMLVLSYRSDELSTSPCLRVLVDSETRQKSHTVLQLEGLQEQHIRALCTQRFGSAKLSPGARDEIIDHIVSEADGSPFLASQLAVLALSELGHTTLDAPEVLTIESLVARRTALLSEPAARLLYVLSAAAQPLSMHLALKLSGATNNARAIVHELSGLGLIRSRTSDGERMLAVYHDRLREAVMTRLLPAERAQLERQLLTGLEAEGDTDPAWLHALALSANEKDAALRYGLLAAERAHDALAFERAAQLYRACLDVCPDPSPQCFELWQKLALALGQSGRGRQAAAAFREAAARAQGTERLMLERSAASHLLRSGAFVEGEALLQKVLTELKIDTPSSTAGLIAAIAWERACLKMRGLELRRRELPATAHITGKLYGTLSVELQPYDPLRAALFQARSLRMAVDCGEPELLARALCVAATMAAVSGGKGAIDNALDLLERARTLEREHPSPLVYGNICSAMAVVSMLRGRMEELLTHSEEAERMYREASGADDGEYYHRFTVITARIAALNELGQHQLARAELQHALNEARATDNVAALLLLSSSITRADIMSDQPERSKLRLEAEHPQLPPMRFGLLHAWHVMSVMRIGCATGDHAWALNRMQRDFERLEQSILKRGGMFSWISAALHARLLLNHCVAQGKSAAEAARSIARDLRNLDALPGPAAAGVAHRTRARLAIIEGDHATGREHLQKSVVCFEKIASRDEAARDRYALAALQDDGHSGAQQTAALETLRDYFGYVNPQKDLRGYFPELFK